MNRYIFHAEEFQITNADTLFLRRDSIILYFLSVGYNLVSDCFAKTMVWEGLGESSFTVENYDKLYVSLLIKANIRSDKSCS